MGQRNESGPEDSPFVDEVLAEFLRRVDAGEAVDREAFLRSYPDAAEALRSYFAGADEVERLAKGLVGGGSDPRPSPSEIDPHLKNRRAEPAPTASGSGTAARQSLGSAETIAPRGLADSWEVPTGPFGSLPAAFGRYRVEKAIGRGAMGSVYLARDTQLDRPVALKVPRLSGHEEQDVLDRFLREARAAANLTHPNICRVFDVGSESGVWFIAMEFVDGRPLAEFIVPGHLHEEKRCANVVRKLAQALDEAHTKGIIHRDLKPANILINQRGEPILMDFGLARLADSSRDGRATRSGMILGSPAYMSPEQANGETDKIGPQSDIYSLGVLLFELLTCQLPFQGSVLTILSQIATKEPPLPSSLRPGLDLRLEAICLKMMAKPRAQRFASMAEVERELTQWLASAPAVAPSTVSSGVRKDPGSSGAMTAVTFASADAPDRRADAARAPTTAASAKDTIGGLQPVPDKSAAAKKSEAVTANDVAKQKQQVIKLLTEHNFAAALPLLEKLARQSAPVFQEAAAWAKSELPAVRERHRKLQEQNAVACTKARTLLDKHDYSGAATLLDQIPVAARTAETTQLLSKASELYDECQGLLTEIEEAIRRKKYDRLQPIIKRYLKLKPDSPKLERLLHDLDRNRPDRAVARFKDTRKYFDVAGRLVEPKEVALSAFALLGLFFAVTYGLRSYLAGSRSSGNVIKPEQLAGNKGPNVPPTNKIGAEATTGAGVGPSGQPSLKNQDSLGQLVFTIQAGSDAGPVEGVAFSPNGKLIATAHWGHMVKIWDATNGQWMLTLKGHTDVVRSVAFSPDGNWLASAGYDKTVKVWNITNGKEVRTMNGHTEKIEYVTFSRDGKWLASASEDDTVRMWDASSGQEILTLKGHKDDVKCVAFNFNGKRLASASFDATVKLWDTTSGQETLTLSGHKGQVTGVAFSTDGKQVASAGTDGTVKVWDSTSGQESRTLSGHSGVVRCVAFSPDGTQLASGSFDKTVKLWNAASGQETHTLNGHTNRITSVTYSSDGQWLASASWDQTVKVWKASISNEATGANTAAPSDNDPSAAFNGRDLTGWTPMLMSGANNETHQPTTSGWKIENGELVCDTDQNGWLRLDKKYANFELSFEFFMDEQSMWGTVLRFSGQGRFGLDIDFVPQSNTQNETGLKPNQWNPYTVRCEGDKLTVHSGNIQRETQLPAALAGEGFLGITNKNGKAKGCRFRSIRVRELSATAAAGSNDGKNDPRGNFAGKWVGKLDNGVAVQFTIMTDSGGNGPTLYEWEENVDGGLQGQQYSSRLQGNTLEVGGTIKITLDGPDQATATGPFQRNARLVRLTRFSGPTGGKEGWVDLLPRNSALATWDELESLSDPQNANLFSTHRPTSGQWTAEGGVLRCVKQAPGWLKSKREYQDFVLELEFKLPPNGNSGVYIRTPAFGHPSDVGMEVQIIDDKRIRNADAFTGSIHRATGATVSASKPIGEWNSMRIECRGNDISVTVNDRQVVQTNMQTNPELRTRPRKGFIGLSNWKGEALGCEFRNIRVRELSMEQQATAKTKAASNKKSDDDQPPPPARIERRTVAMPTVTPRKSQGHSYAVVKESLYWQDAKIRAEELGGHLVTVESEAEWNYIKSMLAPEKHSAWVGATDEAKEGTFVWLTGSKVRSSYWWPNEPNNANGGENFASLNFDDRGKGLLNDSRNEPNWYICEWDREQGPVTTIAPKDWNGHSYALIRTSMKWPVAKAYCEQLGGHLFTAESAPEWKFVFEMTSPSYSWWVGASDAAKEGDWKWITGKPVDRFWAAGEPSNLGGAENFAVIGWNWGDRERGLGDHPDLEHGFVCEWDFIADAGGPKPVPKTPPSATVVAPDRQLEPKFEWLLHGDDLQEWVRSPESKGTSDPVIANGVLQTNGLSHQTNQRLRLYELKFDLKPQMDDDLSIVLANDIELRLRQGVFGTYNLRGIRLRRVETRKDTPLSLNEWNEIEVGLVPSLSTSPRLFVHVNGQLVQSNLYELGSIQSAPIRLVGNKGNAQIANIRFLAYQR